MILFCRVSSLLLSMVARRGDDAVGRKKVEALRVSRCLHGARSPSAGVLIIGSRECNAAVRAPCRGFGLGQISRKSRVSWAGYLLRPVSRSIWLTRMCVCVCVCVCVFARLLDLQGAEKWEHHCILRTHVLDVADLAWSPSSLYSERPLRRSLEEQGEDTSRRNSARCVQ
jgi:hypothetical protein